MQRHLLAAWNTAGAAFFAYVAVVCIETGRWGWAALYGSVAGPIAAVALADVREILRTRKTRA